MPMLRVVLNEQERRALNELAHRELRDPTRQAVVIIRRELQRRGLLPDDVTAADDRPPEVHHA